MNKNCKNIIEKLYERVLARPSVLGLWASYYFIDLYQNERPCNRPYIRVWATNNSNMYELSLSIVDNGYKPSLLNARLMVCSNCFTDADSGFVMVKNPTPPDLERHNKEKAAREFLDMFKSLASVCYKQQRAIKANYIY